MDTHLRPSYFDMLKISCIFAEVGRNYMGLIFCNTSEWFFEPLRECVLIAIQK